LPNPIREVGRAAENIQDFFEDVQNPVRDMRRAAENYREFLRDLFFCICIILKIAVVIAISYPIIEFYHSLSIHFQAKTLPVMMREKKKN
jgi:hypothetical protein